MKQVLMITDVDFWRSGAGHRARIKEIIRFIAPFIKLTVLVCGYDHAEGFIADRPFELLFLKGNAKDHDRNNSEIIHLIGNRRFDHVIVEYLHLTYMLQFVNEDAVTILDMHDIISDRADSFKTFGISHADVDRETEYEFLGAYDHIITICEPDFRILSKDVPGSNLLLCPHALTSRPRTNRKIVKSIGFIASEYAPNVDGINYFIANCWPFISRPSLTLDIYGNVCKKVSTAEAGIILHGFKTDLDHIYESIDIAINPVRFGAGLKIKNVEALAYAVPLVTTNHGARGIEHLPGPPLQIAETPAAFISSLNELMSLSERDRLSKAACEAVKTYFSPEHCYQPLLRLLQGD